MKLLIFSILIGIIFFIVMTHNIVVWALPSSITVWSIPHNVHPDNSDDILRRKEFVYNYAVMCSKIENPPPLSDIKIKLIDDDNIYSFGNYRVEGFYDVKTKTIMLRKENVSNFKVFAHEMLHAIGFIGHPTVPFKYPCDVQSDYTGEN